jgi:hypothetical protein
MSNDFLSRKPLNPINILFFYNFLCIFDFFRGNWVTVELGEEMGALVPGKVDSVRLGNTEK